MEELMTIVAEAERLNKAHTYASGVWKWIFLEQMRATKKIAIDDAILQADPFMPGIADNFEERMAARPLNDWETFNAFETIRAILMGEGLGPVHIQQATGRCGDFSEYTDEDKLKAIGVVLKAQLEL